jgi:hypothetical protein
MRPRGTPAPSFVQLHIHCGSIQRVSMGASRHGSPECGSSRGNGGVAPVAQSVARRGATAGFQRFRAFLVSGWGGFLVPPWWGEKSRALDEHPFDLERTRVRRAAPFSLGCRRTNRIAGMRALGEHAGSRSEFGLSANSHWTSFGWPFRRDSLAKVTYTILVDCTFVLGGPAGTMFHVKRCDLNARAEGARWILSLTNPGFSLV